MGGAIYQNLQNPETVLTVLSTNFSNCVSTLAGGAIYAICASFDIKDSLFNRTITQHLHDYTSIAYAGACCLIGTGSAGSTITNTHFLKCASDVAGAVMLWASSSIDLAGCLFEQCAATRSGAGVFLANTEMLDMSLVTNITTCLAEYLSDHPAKYLDASLTCLASTPLVAHCTEYLASNAGDYIGALLTYALSPELAAIVTKVIKSQNASYTGYVDAFLKSVLNDTLYQSLTSFLRNHPEEYVLGMLQTVLSDEVMTIVTPLVNFDFDTFASEAVKSFFNRTFIDDFTSYLEGTQHTTIDYFLAVTSYFVNDDIAKALKTYLSGNPFDIAGAFQTVLKEKYKDIAAMFDISSLFNMASDMVSNVAETVKSALEELPSVTEVFHSLFGKKETATENTNALMRQFANSIAATTQRANTLTDEAWFTNFSTIIERIGSDEAKQILSYITTQNWEGLTKSFFSTYVSDILTSAINYAQTAQQAATPGQLSSQVEAAIALIKPIVKYAFTDNAYKWITESLLPNLQDPEKLFESLMTFVSSEDMAALMNATLDKIKQTFGDVYDYMVSKYSATISPDDLFGLLYQFGHDLVQEMIFSDDFVYLMSEAGQADLKNTLSYFIRYDAFQSFLKEKIDPILGNVLETLMKNSTFASLSGLATYLSAHADDYIGAATQCFKNADLGTVIEHLLDSNLLNNFIHHALPYYVSDAVNRHLPTSVRSFEYYLQAVVQGYFEGSELSDVITKLKRVLNGSDEDTSQLVAVGTAFFLNKYALALIPISSPDIPEFLKLVIGTTKFNQFKNDNDVTSMNLSSCVPALLRFYASDKVKAVLDVIDALSTTSSARTNDLASMMQMLQQFYTQLIALTGGQTDVDTDLIRILVPLLFNKNIATAFETARQREGTDSDSLYLLAISLFQQDFVQPFFDYGEKDDLVDYFLAFASMFIEKDALNLLKDLVAGKFITFTKRFVELYLNDDSRAIYNKYLTQYPGHYLLALASPALSTALRAEMDKYSKDPSGVLGAVVSYTFSHDEIIAGLTDGVKAELTVYMKEFKCTASATEQTLSLSSSPYIHVSNADTSSSISVTMANCAFMDNTVDGQFVKSGVDVYIPAQTSSSASSDGTTTTDAQTVAITLKMNSCYTNTESSISFKDTDNSLTSTSSASLRTTTNPAASAGTMTPTETQPHPLSYSTSDDDNGGGLSGGAVAGIVIAVLVVVAAMAAVIVFFIIRARREKDDSTSYPSSYPPTSAPTDQTSQTESYPQPSASDIPMTEEAVSQPPHTQSQPAPPPLPPQKPTTAPPPLPKNAPPPLPARPPPLPANKPPTR